MTITSFPSVVATLMSGVPMLPAPTMTMFTGDHPERGKRRPTRRFVGSRVRPTPGSGHDDSVRARRHGRSVRRQSARTRHSYSPIHTVGDKIQRLPFDTAHPTNAARTPEIRRFRRVLELLSSPVTHDARSSDPDDSQAMPPNVGV
jgi:hypothetical protein